MKLPLLAAGLVLVAGTATACGGGAPTDASKEDFCDEIINIAETSAAVALDTPTEDRIKEMKAAFADLEEVGTPEDMSDDAREGFELITESVADVDDDASAEELEKAGDDFSGDDEKKTDAFGAYVAENCDLSSVVPGMPEMPEMPETSPPE
jgi:hypothetical protein